MLTRYFSFLNDLERIASRDYVVSDNDIVRARLRTVGIQEHRLKFANGPYDSQKSTSPAILYNDICFILFVEGSRESGWEWRIFDVGGCRTSVRGFFASDVAMNLSTLFHINGIACGMASLFR